MLPEGFALMKALGQAFVIAGFVLAHGTITPSGRCSPSKFGGQAIGRKESTETWLKLMFGAVAEARWRKSLGVTPL